MSEELYNLEIKEIDPEYAFDLAEDIAHRRGYTVNREEDILQFQDSHRTYELEIEDEELSIYGEPTGAIRAYKAILENEL